MSHTLGVTRGVAAEVEEGMGSVTMEGRLGAR
jgi:hypothetical protein